MAIDLNDFEADVDDRPVFETGDQDYGSAAGWDPRREANERILAEARKKTPRDYAPLPEMLWVREAQYYIGIRPHLAVTTQLFGPFWLQYEMAILFARTGVGKSVLATQIAESLARGLPFEAFAGHDGPRPEPQRVLYIDFELTGDQFTLRYTCVGEDASVLPYQMSPDFLRAVLYWNGRMIDGYEDFTDMIFEDIGALIDSHEATILIVDNITFLSRKSTANASIAFRLMDRLQNLKKDHRISILVLAHTPKQAARGVLTENDMQGSIDLAKVADSVFAMGRSRHSPDMRYVKHIKARTGRLEHGEENVAVFNLEKFDHAASIGLTQNPDRPAIDNFLGFKFVRFEHERYLVEPQPRRSLLPHKSRLKRDKAIVSRVKRLAAEGKSSAAVAAELGIPKTTAYRYIHKT